MALALSKHLISIENILKHEKPFMMGDQYTAIDSCMTSILHRINEMRFTNLLTTHFLTVEALFQNSLFSYQTSPQTD